MAKREAQIRMVRPVRQVNAERLTPRQREVLSMMLWHGKTMSLAEIDRKLSYEFSGRTERVHAYRQLSAAMSRLEKRGLVQRIKRGTYCATVVRERKA